MGSLTKLFSQLNQGINFGRDKIFITSSKIVDSIIQILCKEGIIFGCRKQGRQVAICLKYSKGVSVIKGIKLYRKSGVKRSKHLKELKSLTGNGIYLVSTTAGIMTHSDAVVRGLGGVLVGYIEI